MKPIKRVDLSKLDAEQKAALQAFLTNCRMAAPHVQEMQDAAKAVFANMIRSPQWGIADGEQPENGTPRESLWHVGAPEVNYVDHIERPDQS